MEINNPNKTYHTNGDFIYSCIYHVIFCPKYRRSVLINGIETRLKELILSKQDEYQYSIIEQEIMPIAD